MELIMEACTQYTTLDKFNYAFGVTVTTVAALETTLDASIVSAYTYTVESETYVAYFVSDANGVTIDTGHGDETIYPTVAVSIKTSDDTIAAAKVLTNATSHAWAKSFYTQVETHVAGFVGADSNSVITGAYTDYDAIASATYSCEGMFNYVKVAFSQYVNTDKALLTGGNA
jgi:hypothetical protein